MDLGSELCFLRTLAKQAALQGVLCGLYRIMSGIMFGSKLEFKIFLALEQNVA